MAKPLHNFPATTASSLASLVGVGTRAGLATLCLLIAGGLIGCRGVNNAQLDLLERELREQEDYIYELEDYLMEYSEKLRQYRMASQEAKPAPAGSAPATRSTLVRPELVDDPPRRPPSGKGRATTKRPAPVPAAPPARSLPVEPSVAAPAGDVDPLPEIDVADPAELEPPDLEIGDPGASLQWQPSEPVASTPAAAATKTSDGAGDSAIAPMPAEEAPPFVPEPLTFETAPDEAAPLAATISPFAAPEPEAYEEAVAPTAPSEPTSVDAGLVLAPADAGAELPPAEEPAFDAARAIATQLQVRQVFTQPAPGDPTRLEGLLVVVEALNAMDEPVEAVGTASLMVMVRDASGIPQRVDRWDFTAEETRAAWQSSRLGDGLHLQLPLAGKELPGGQLELWARLADGDGGKLLTQLPFDAAALVALDDAIAAPVEAAIASAPVDAGPAVEPSATNLVSPAPVEPAPAAAPAPTWRAATREIDGLAEAADRAAGGASAGWTASKATGLPVGSGTVTGVAPLKTSADAANGEAPAVKTASGASSWQRQSTTTR